MKQGQGKASSLRRDKVREVRAMQESQRLGCILGNKGSVLVSAVVRSGLQKSPCPAIVLGAQSEKR